MATSISLSGLVAYCRRLELLVAEAQLVGTLHSIRFVGFRVKGVLGVMHSVGFRVRV